MLVISLGSLQVFRHGAIDAELQAESCGLNSLGCPGSPVAESEHSACGMSVVFEASCADVQQEIEARITGNVDRKALPGNYFSTSSESNTCTKGGRDTNANADPGPFTDLFGFLYGGSGNSCTISGCSESQVNSLCDMSTNFCNMFNLYCNSNAGCTPQIHDLSYGSVKYDESCNHTDSCGGMETVESECTRR